MHFGLLNLVKTSCIKVSKPKIWLTHHVQYRHMFLLKLKLQQVEN